MTKQERIENAAGVPLTFLPEEWDQALMGFAKSGNAAFHKVPAYGYQAIKHIIQKKTNSPEALYSGIKKILSLFTEDEGPLLVIHCGNDYLWETIRNHAYPRFEHLDKAIIGIGAIDAKPCGVVYNYRKALSILQEIQVTSSDAALETQLQAETLLSESLSCVSLGENTPWFLSPIT